VLEKWRGQDVAGRVFLYIVISCLQSMARKNNKAAKPAGPPKPKKQGPSAAQRRKARKGIQNQLRDIHDAIQSPNIIGKGAYNFAKAYNGKNAASKRSNYMSRAIDIGGRSLNALKQANSGDYMGALMSGMKILGKGDYQLTRNTIAQDLVAQQVPNVHGANESIRFRHREFLGDIFSPATAGAFSASTYSINPGLASTFPFLAPIAQQFQEYKFHGLVFEYKSTSAVAIGTANIGMGVVAMAAQYRADAPKFTDKLTMMNEMWSVDGRPSDCFMLPIECAPEECPMSCLYVRGTAISTTSDNVKFYDLARITLAMTGIPVVEQQIGELWISYDVELFKPQATSILDAYQSFAEFTVSGVLSGSMFTNATIAYDCIGFDTSTTITPTGRWSPNSGRGLVGVSAPFTLYTSINSSTLTTSVSVVAGSIIFPLGTVGVFSLAVALTGTSSTPSYVAGSDAFGNSIAGASTAAYQNNWVGLNAFYTSPPAAGTTGGHYTLHARILSSSSQAVITFNFLLATAAAGTWYIAQLNNNYV